MSARDSMRGLPNDLALCLLLTLAVLVAGGFAVCSTHHDAATDAEVR